MNSMIGKLHTSARRYCMTKYDYWQKLYFQLQHYGQDRDGSRYTNQALDIFPRYNILKAIMSEIEKFVPEDFTSLQEARELLISVGSTAKDIFTKQPHGYIERNAIDEERQLYILFIQSVNQADIENIEPLPFKKVLTITESHHVWNMLKESWGIIAERHWYPLVGTKLAKIEAFNYRYFYEEFGSDAIQLLLVKNGILRLWELRELTEISNNYELEPISMDLSYNLGGEGYWSSHNLDWIIYISHEGSITFGGWILDEVKNNWSNWNEQIWKS